MYFIFGEIFKAIIDTPLVFRRPKLILIQLFPQPPSRHKELKDFETSFLSYQSRLCPSDCMRPFPLIEIENLAAFLDKLRLVVSLTS